jgi:hypothetical protein
VYEEPIKVCPDCGSESQNWVERCLDCGAPLVHPDQVAFHERQREESEELYAPDDLVYVRTAPPSWIRALREDLDGLGIDSWIAEVEKRNELCLFVRQGDKEAAAAVDRARFELEVPDAKGGGGPPEVARRPRREPSPEDTSIKLCPRCGGEYQLWAERCADCGVPLVHPWDFDEAVQKETAAARRRSARSEGSDENACPACGERLQPGVRECPECGLVLAGPVPCPECKEEVDPPASRCPHCGRDLET